MNKTKREILRVEWENSLIDAEIPTEEISLFLKGFDAGLKEADANPSPEVEGIARTLQGILEIGKRDMSNPKYDTYFKSAIEALSNYRASMKIVIGSDK